MRVSGCLPPKRRLDLSIYTYDDNNAGNDEIECSSFRFTFIHAFHSFFFFFFLLSSRLTCKLAGLDFDDVQVSEWPALKPTTPHGTLPIMQIDDGPVRVQSQAMVRYLASEYSETLYPKENLFDIEEAIGLAGDFQRDWGSCLYIAMSPSSFGHDKDFAKTEEGKAKIKEMREVSVSLCHCFLVCFFKTPTHICFVSLVSKKGVLQRRPSQIFGLLFGNDRQTRWQVARVVRGSDDCGLHSHSYVARLHQVSDYHCPLVLPSSSSSSKNSKLVVVFVSFLRIYGIPF
jgi:Glutathione S-transferase, N-terminal domain